MIAQELKTFALELADQARAVLAQSGQGGLDVEVKPDRTLVTRLDKAIEERLRAHIEQRFPGHGVIGEEHGTKATGSDFTWVLDPIDGTSAFIAGVPVYGTLIALAHENVPVLGIIDIPELNRRWFGCAGEQTTLNGVPCRVRGCDSLASAMMSNGNPDFYAAEERPALERLRAATNCRIYGAASLAYGLLASGRTDLTLDTGQKVYDFGPFRPIIEGAGGIVTDWQGRALTLESSGQLLAAGDAGRHAEAVQIVQAAMAVSAVAPKES